MASDLLWSPLLISLAGFGSFGWALYKYPNFRRKTIESLFQGHDYVYQQYHQWRYDNQVREVEIRKYQPSGILLSSNNHQLRLEKEEFHDFLTKTQTLRKLSHQENHYYHLKGNSDSEQLFSLEDVLELPWLAVSLKIKTDKDEHEVDITEKWKKFWIKINILPFHLEYYDLWIKELLPDLDLKKNQIKELELIIIDEMGNFVNHQNVLIKPHHQGDQINLIPLPSLKILESEKSNESYQSNLENKNNDNSYQSNLENKNNDKSY